VKFNRLIQGRVPRMKLNRIAQRLPLRRVPSRLRLDRRAQGAALLTLCALIAGAVVLLTGSTTVQRHGKLSADVRTAFVQGIGDGKAAAPVTQSVSPAVPQTSAGGTSSSTSSTPSSVGSQLSAQAGSTPSSTSGGTSGSSAPSGGSPSPSTFNSTNTPATDSRSRVHVTVGVSDNGGWIFGDPKLQRLHVKAARDVIFWNVAVMRDKTQLNAVRAWLNGARADHITPLISFAGNGNYVPSIPVYTAAVKAFLHDFPWVKTYTPWNEPDWIYRPSLANNPSLAAGYFNTLAYWCHHCTIVAGDVYRPASDGLASWVATYKRYLHARPTAWALHPYDDIRSHTTSQIQTMEGVTGGSIWLDEISGVERRGHWGFPNQSPNGANRDERFLFALPKRFHWITRIYHYQWQAVPAAPWDSGLLGPQGKARPAYWTFANAVHGKLP
jgi:hypothetical protein